ncbi:MAG: hypothetical protein J7M19_01850 [Planctomycetes bacterium]|nr:hypothetical protein [Planctomycetota bacterium]
MPKTFKGLLVILLVAAGAARVEAASRSILDNARLALDTGNPSEAASLFERALAAAPSYAEALAPERAWTYIKLGNEALKTEDLAAAEDYYSLASAIYPPYRDMFMPQWAFVKLRRVNEALRAASKDNAKTDWKALTREIRWIIHVNPDHRQAHFTLGILYEWQHKSQAARNCYINVIGGLPPGRDKSIAALREAAKKAASHRHYTFDLRPVFPPWRLSDPGPFQTYAQGPFIIHHHNEALARRLAEVFEYYLSRPALNGVLEANGPFPKECDVYVFRDEKAFQDSGGQEVWAGGQAKFHYMDGVLLSVKIQLFQTAPELTNSAAPHELAHVRLLAASPFVEGLPLWLQEGVATSTEPRNKKEMLAKALARARDAGTMMPFEKLMAAATYPKDVPNDVYYAESVATVESLVGHYGAERFWKFVKAIETVGQERALVAVYDLTDTDVENLILEWTAARQ